MVFHLFLQLAPLALLTAGVVVCAAIFVSLKKEIHALSLEVREHGREAVNLEQRSALQLAELETRLREAEDRAGVLVQPPSPASGFNLSRRSQAMRMSRHGEAPANIAAALSLPRNEVELLLKVQKIILNNLDGPVTS